MNTSTHIRVRTHLLRHKPWDPSLDRGTLSGDWWVHRLNSAHRWVTDVFTSFVISPAPSNLLTTRGLYVCLQHNYVLFVTIFPWLKAQGIPQQSAVRQSGQPCPWFWPKLIIITSGPKDLVSFPISLLSGAAPFIPLLLLALTPCLTTGKMQNQSACPLRF